MLRYILSIVLFFSLKIFFGQGALQENSFKKYILQETNLHKDTLVKIRIPISNYSVNATRHNRPLIVANGVIIRFQQLDTTLIKNISALTYNEGFIRFYYAGSNGVISIETKQKFKTVTLFSIRDRKDIEGDVIYAINGYYTTDSTLKISTKAIRQIQIFDQNDNAINASSTVINIWTLKRKERKPLGAN
jgi:hypothetical protein